MKSILVILSFILLTNGCIPSKQAESHLKEITGLSTIVGNEPFSRSAILTDQNDIYLIDGSAEVKTLLYENQGKYFIITYNNLRDSSDLQIINVISAIKQ